MESVFFLKGQPTCLKYVREGTACFLDVKNISYDVQRYFRGTCVHTYYGGDEKHHQQQQKNS